MNWAAGQVRDDRRERAMRPACRSAARYSQPLRTTVNPPTTRLQITAFANPAFAGRVSRPATTPSALVHPPAHDQRRELRVQEDEREAALGGRPEEMGQHDVGREDEHRQAEPGRDRDERVPDQGRPAPRRGDPASLASDPEEALGTTPASAGSARASRTSQPFRRGPRRGRSSPGSRGPSAAFSTRLTLRRTSPARAGRMADARAAARPRSPIASPARPSSSRPRSRPGTARRRPPLRVRRAPPTTAAARSSTWMKSRVCSPSPWITIGSPSRAARSQAATTLLLWRERGP